MPGRSRLSLRTLVALLIGGIGLLLIAQSATLLIVAAPGYLGAQRIAALTLADQALFQTLFYRRLSDTPVIAALTAETPIDQREVGTIAENRHRATVIYPDAVRLLRELDLPGAAAVLENLRFASDAWAEVTARADAAIRLPKSGREAASVQEQIRRANASIASATAAINFLDAAIVPLDHIADRMILVRRLAWSMRDHLESIMRASQASATEGKPLSVDKLLAIAGQRGQVARDWSELTEIANRPDIPPALVNAIISAGQWYSGTDPVEQNRPGLGEAGEVLAALAKVATTATDAVAEWANEQTVTVTRDLVIEAMSLGIAVVVTLTTLFIAHSRVSQPLVAITTAVQRLAEGDTEAECEGIGGGDEVDVLARAMQVFRGAMLRAEAQAAELAAQADVEAERKAVNEAMMAEMSDKMAEQIAPVAACLLQLADGDLTCVLRERLPPHLDDLRQNFNEALHSLQASLRHLAGRIDDIHRTADGLTDAAAAFSRRGDAHGNTLRQAIAALDALATNLDSGQVDTIQSQSTATATVHQAGVAAALMAEAAERVAAFDEIARRVATMVDEIDEFAFQANLTATRAGLAGARLGGDDVTEAAGEIRALAQRAGAASGEIKTQMTAAAQHAVRGSRLLNESREISVRIGAGVAEMGAAIALCAATAQTQSLGLDAFRVLLTQIGHVTEQNAGTAAVSVTTARALADQADELKAALWRFRLPEDSPAERAA